MNIAPKPEFSRIVKLSDIPPKGVEMTIEADENERQRLSQRFGLVGLPHLSAHIRLFPVKDLFRLEGRVTAVAVQSCVVTLEPVESKIEEDFSRLYGTDQALSAAMAALEVEIDIDPEAEDLPDPIQDGGIDIGEAAAEELALNLDPFPRKPGASLDGSPFAAKPEERKNSPFAGLSKLRDKPFKKV